MIDILKLPTKTLQNYLSEIETEFNQLDENLRDSKFLNGMSLIKSIQSGLLERSYAFDVYKKLLIDNVIFHESNEDHIRINNDDIQYESLICILHESILAKMGGIYDSCSRLCELFLATEANPIIFSHASHLVLEEKQSKIIKSQQQVCGKLRGRYGYHFSIFLALRNITIHRGWDQFSGGGPWLLQSSSPGERLKIEALKNIEKWCKEKDKLSEDQLSQFDLASYENKTLIDLLNALSAELDHVSGLVIKSCRPKF